MDIAWEQRSAQVADAIDKQCCPTSLLPFTCARQQRRFDILASLVPSDVQQCVSPRSRAESSPRIRLRDCKQQRRCAIKVILTEPKADITKYQSLKPATLLVKNHRKRDTNLPGSGNPLASSALGLTFHKTASPWRLRSLRRARSKLLTEPS